MKINLMTFITVTFFVFALDAVGSLNTKNMKMIENEIIGKEDAFIFTYVNDVSNRRFLIFRKGVPWKTIVYQPSNQFESYGEIKGDELYSYVNDVSLRRFLIYRDGSPWKIVAYNPANQAETFGMIMANNPGENNEFYSYTNDLSKRSFSIYRNGILWKTIAYNSSNNIESFGQFGAPSAYNTIHGNLYSYVNDVSNSCFLIYRNGSHWKTIPYNPLNQVESFGEITSNNNFISYVNDVSNRQFLLYQNGVLWKTFPYYHLNQAESLANIVSFEW